MEKRVNFYLSEEMFEALRAAAGANDRTVSHQLRALVREFVAASGLTKALTSPARKKFTLAKRRMED